VKRVIHEEANREFREALLHYVSISPELGARFYREMEQLMLDVCDRPTLFRHFDPPARRHFTDRFPYGVIYLLEPDHVWIVAVMHLHREPGYWRERLA
jgi:plasmid stabilization system protein ParE